MNKQIEINGKVYGLLAEFDSGLVDDFENRKIFLKALNTSRTVQFLEAYKNILTYTNSDYAIICEDYRFGFNNEAAIDTLVSYVDVCGVYKIKPLGVKCW